MDIDHILSLPPDERDEEIRKLLNPEPREHVMRHRGYDGAYECKNCKRTWNGMLAFIDDKCYTCPVPDPIALDWRLAMKMRDEFCNTPMHEIEFLIALESVYIEAPDFTGFKWWIATKAQPHHYILAALAHPTTEAEDGK